MPEGPAAETGFRSRIVVSHARRVTNAPSAATEPRVQLFGKPGCHLCDDARLVVQAVCAELGVGWAETDILGDPDLLARMGEYIPVVLVDGEQHDFWRVDPDRLRAALR